MSISVGDSLPEATLLSVGPNGPEQHSLGALTQGKTVVMFGLPGPFTNTCSEAHLPSFIRVRDALAEKGVDEVICFAVVDPFVMKAWSDASGAEEAGIRMLADSSGELTRALGLHFDAPSVGLYGRTKRHSMLVEDGVVRVLNFEETHGLCDLTAGETLLDMI